MRTAKLSRTGKRIELRFPFDSDANAAVSALPDASFRYKPEPIWSVPATRWHLEQLQNTLGGYFDYDADVLALKQSALSSPGRDKLWDERLYQFQQEGIDFIVSANGRALIADDMGLGKTVEALVWAQKQKDISKILVVCPATVVYKWSDEVVRWAPRFTPRVFTKSAQEVPQRCLVADIMSYGIFSRKQDELAYDLLILDEAHYVKSVRVGKKPRGSQRGLAAQRVGGRCKYILALTGTPILNRPMEIFPVLHILDPRAWSSGYAFGMRYCGGLGYDGWFKGATNLDELKARLQPICIRRMKSEVLSQLPPLTRTIIPVQIGMSKYHSVKAQVREAIRAMNPDHKGYFVGALDRLNALRQIVGLEKAEIGGQWAKEFLESTDTNEKLVVYTHHREVADRVAYAVAQFGVVKITGETPLPERAKIIAQYQGKGGPRCLVITSAGGQGIDLFGKEGTSASTILFVEREWNPALEEQAEARLHRIGQEHGVNAHYLSAIGTIDDKFARMIERKRAVIKEAIGDADVTTIIKDLIDDILEE